MKINSLVNVAAENKKMLWNNDPKIGWVFESESITLYYGTIQSNVTKILREGIYAGEDGHILCSLEPNTAVIHSTMRSLISESGRPFTMVDTPIVFAVNFPYSFYSKMVIFEDPNERMNQEIYESWGKSDVEYYAFINIGIPDHISVERITGYMVK